MKENRNITIDFLRTSAMFFMVIFHVLFDLYYFFGFNLDIYGGPASALPGISSALFLAVSGYSSGFSRKPFRRAGQVLFWAAAITFISFFLFPEAPILFGILHCIGICMLLFPLFSKAGNITLAVSAICILTAGFFFRTVRVESFLLLPLGIRPVSFYSVDYYPLFPSLAFFITGIILFRIYGTKKTDPLRGRRFFEKISLPGRFSLQIYLLHQPLIIAFLSLFLNENIRNFFIS